MFDCILHLNAVFSTPPCPHLTNGAVVRNPNPRKRPMSESFADLFNESIKRTEMRNGEVITAEIVRIEKGFVVVNAGLKSEAYIPEEEFKNDAGVIEATIGDFIAVSIESIENGYGDTLLSRDRAKRLSAWMALESAMELISI